MENITCFKTGWSALLDVGLWLKWLSIFSDIATVTAVIVAIIAAKIAYKQLLSSVKESKSSTANSIYQQYLHLCMEHPAFSLGMEKPDERNEEYAKYCWFVSSMLFSFEQVLEINDDNEKWLKTIESQLSRHASHLKSSSTVSDGHWNDNLESLINKVISE
ncbi:hypothetical protein K0H59_14890 [Shewanella sp. FJAT-51649]|uniref:hypothetical protein n=1 Tax=Shewanella sp. FJAT-51649 TaxID=2864210 RepID=UPI001C65AA18|nr:hypothetical protein [Shewanella sp. FJAT-51649]QYJ70308.1 hypothetical protein K0H59_14890 [Shewanella sp. FJAT-51649]